jgi:hypothetical protein
VRPPALDLETSGLTDLDAVFESRDWQTLVVTEPERELPFMMHLKVNGKDCWIRGRMDVVVPGDPVRVVDYKYATWQQGVEADYAPQMTAYSLAVMKALGTDGAVSELWYLKPPMKIVRKEYTRSEAEGDLVRLLTRYLTAVQSDSWPAADRGYCDRVECGFRAQCWPGA